MLNLDASNNSTLDENFGYTPIANASSGSSLDSLFQRHEISLNAQGDDLSLVNFYPASSSENLVEQNILGGGSPLKLVQSLEQFSKSQHTTSSRDTLTGTSESQPLVGGGNGTIAALSQAAPAQTNNVSPSNASAPSVQGFNFANLYGYGLVDAAAAVAWSVGYFDLPDVTDWGNSWNNNMINAPEVWSQGITGQDVTVAVIDSGVDIGHSDLNDNVWVNTDEILGDGIDNDGNGYVDDRFGWNFGGNNNNILDFDGHGTHVAGTIAAEANGFGVTGVAPNARIMPVKIGDTDSNGAFTNPNANLAAAVRYAVDNGADVINMSLSWTPSSALTQALAYAASRNVITVVASGNEGSVVPTNLASYSTNYGLSVGSVDVFTQVANNSNRAGFDRAMQYVVAPGVEVYSTMARNVSHWDNDYGRLSGTSMAAPHVAGTVALMLDANPNLTHSQVRSIVTNSAIG